MSELIVVTYPDRDEAERVIRTAERLQSEYLMQLDDYAYVTRDPDGTISLHERLNRPAFGAARGALWGAVVGRIFGSPWIGAGVGAATGAIAGQLESQFENSGIDERFVRALSANLPPGSSAVFALVQRSTPDKVMPEVGKFGGTVIHTSLSNAEEDLLQARIDEAHRKATRLRETSSDASLGVRSARRPGAE
jgi:uncharacterized membrane protein